MPDLPPALRAVLDEFRDNPVGAELSARPKASGRCKPAALTLLGLLRDRGYQDARLLRFDREPEHHWVVQLGELALDPSARQFDASADVPDVRALTEMKEEWGEPDVIDLGDAWTRKLWQLPSEPPSWAQAMHGLAPRAAGFKDPD